jgi:PII-like signaling protein
VHAAGKLPLVVQLVDRAEKVTEVIPAMRRMAGDRLITAQDVQAAPPPGSDAA